MVDVTSTHSYSFHFVAFFVGYASSNDFVDDALCAEVSFNIVWSGQRGAPGARLALPVTHKRVLSKPDRISNIQQGISNDQVSDEANSRSLWHFIRWALAPGNWIFLVGYWVLASGERKERPEEIVIRSPRRSRRPGRESIG